MKKFRIKLETGEEIGPFTAEEVGEVYKKGHLLGDELCQNASSHSENWVKFREVPEIYSIIEKLIFNDAEKRPEKAEKKEKSKDIHEFKYNKNENPEINIEKNKSDDLELEKTLVLNKKPKTKSIDKTVVVKRAEKEEREPTDIPEKKLTQVKKTEEKSVKKEMMKEYFEGDTVLNKDISALQAQAIKESHSFEFDIKKEKEIKKPKIKEKKVEQKKLFKLLPVLVAMLVVSYLFFPDKNKNSSSFLNPISVQISFPRIHDVEDYAKAREYYRSAELIEDSSYLKKIEKINLYKRSLYYKFADNKALGKLILGYVDVLENASDPKIAIKTISKLILISRAKIYKDINVALGTAIFYSKIGRPKTSQKIFENYLRTGQPSALFLAYYLNTLIEIGDRANAEKVFKKLSKTKKKSLEVYVYLFKYLSYSNLHEEGREILDLGEKYFGNNVQFLLARSQSQFNLGNYESLGETLVKIRKLEAERSPLYLAKYFEFRGIYSVFVEKIDRAILSFEKSLAIKDSDELRSKLATLQIGGGRKGEKIILESKVSNLMLKAKESSEKKNWEEAFKYAIESVDLIEGYIPSRLLLSKIQIKRGHYDFALNILTELEKKYPRNFNINIALIDLYVKMRKFKQVESKIQLIQNLEQFQNRKFLNAVGGYYLGLGKYNLAIKYYSESLKEYPFDDLVHFALGKIYLKYRKYKAAKKSITRALELNPGNSDYVKAYSRILYELKDVKTAIGYLRFYLEKYPNNTKILGDIAIYYYLSGQIDQFNNAKKKIEELNAQDESFYQFLIHAEKLNDKPKNISKYYKELIKLNPGNIQVYMDFGLYYLGQNDLENAQKIFEQVEKRAPFIPKIHYYLGKIYLHKKEYKKSLKAGKEEIKRNPRMEFGYLIAGKASKELKKYIDSVKFLEKSLSFNFDNVETLLSLAWLKERQGFGEQARELYLRAKKIEPRNPKIYRELGFIYKKEGHRSLAAETLQNYLNISPTASDRAEIEMIIKTLR